MDRMRLMVERKLRSEISQKDRDLRRMLGHFDMLERVDSQEYIAGDVVRISKFASSHGSTQLRDTSSAHVENGDVQAHEDCSPSRDRSDLDKDMVVIDGIEVDNNDESATSHDCSISDNDELHEYDDEPGAHCKHVQRESCHSPPSYVQDAINELNKMSLEPSIEENPYEVSEDDWERNC